MTLIVATLVVMIACLPSRRRRLVSRRSQVRGDTESVATTRRSIGSVRSGELLFVPITAAVGLVVGSPLLAVASPVVAVAAHRERSRRRRRCRRRTRSRAMVDFAESTAAGLRAGGSLSTAVVNALGRSRVPADRAVTADRSVHHPHSGLDRVGESLGAGIPLSTAFTAAFADGSGSSDERLVATVIAALHGSGGSAVDALERVAETLREREAWRQDLRTQGQQALSSAAVMSALPLVFGVAVAMADRDVARLYLTHWLGGLCAGSGLLLGVIGWEWQQRLLEVDR